MAVQLLLINFGTRTTGTSDCYNENCHFQSILRHQIVPRINRRYSRIYGMLSIYNYLDIAFQINLESFSNWRQQIGLHHLLRHDVP